MVIRVPLAQIGRVDGPDPTPLGSDLAQARDLALALPSFDRIPQSTTRRDFCQPLSKLRHSSYLAHACPPLKTNTTMKAAPKVHVQIDFIFFFYQIQKSGQGREVFSPLQGNWVCIKH